MSPISCPLCKHQNLASAATCRSCGHPLDIPELIENQPNGFFDRTTKFFNEQNPNSRKWMVLSAISGLIAVILLSFVFFGFIKSFYTNPALERELCRASIEGDLAKVKKLVENGVNVNTTVYESVNPLVLAILFAAPARVEDSPSEEKRLLRLKIVRLLIDNGVDVSGVVNSRSPLSIARSIDDDRELELMLVRAGANPNTPIEEGVADANQRKINAATIKFVYYVAATNAAQKVIDDEKRRIVDGDR